MTKAAPGYHDMPAAVSHADLQAMGRGAVAYIKKYRMKGQSTFVLHAADGSAISAQPTAEDARRLAFQQDLEVVTVQ